MFHRIILFFLLSTISFGQWPGAGSKMPAIGVVRGSVTDSTMDQPIEYASISLCSESQTISPCVCRQRGRHIRKRESRQAVGRS